MPAEHSARTWIAGRASTFAAQVLRAGRALLALALLLAASAVPAQQGRGTQAGRVAEITGAVTAVRGSGTSTTLKANDTFEENTTFMTRSDSFAILVFADGQVIVLGRNTRFRIRRYTYDTAQPTANRIDFVLEQGSARFVSGRIAGDTPARVSFMAGTSNANVLKPGATDFIVTVNTAPAEHGAISVAAGRVAVRSPYGQTGPAEVGEAARWGPAVSGASTPDASLPPEVLAVVNDLRNIPLPATLAARSQAAPAVSRVWAGEVREVSGTLRAEVNGRQIELVAGDRFGPGTTFDANGGQATLAFTDGQVVILARGAVATLQAYRYVPADPSGNRVDVGLAAGTMRFVSGFIASTTPDQVRLTAGATGVDITERNGVDLVLTVRTRPAEVGALSVLAGQVALNTPYGQISSTAANQSAQWAPRGNQFPMPAAALPAGLQAEFAAISAIAITPALVERVVASLQPPAATETVAGAVAPFRPVTQPTGGGGCVGSPC